MKKGHVASNHQHPCYQELLRLDRSLIECVLKIRKFRMKYHFQRRTVFRLQKEIDDMRQFLNECNMLDYYECFVKDHRLDGDRSGVPAHHPSEGSKQVDDLPF